MFYSVLSRRISGAGTGQIPAGCYRRGAISHVVISCRGDRGRDGSLQRRQSQRLVGNAISCPVVMLHRGPSTADRGAGRWWHRSTVVSPIRTSIVRKGAIDVMSVGVIGFPYGRMGTMPMRHRAVCAPFGRWHDPGGCRNPKARSLCLGRPKMMVSEALQGHGSRAPRQRAAGSGVLGIVRAGAGLLSCVGRQISPVPAWRAWQGRCLRCPAREPTVAPRTSSALVFPGTVHCLAAPASWLVLVSRILQPVSSVFLLRQRPPLCLFLLWLVRPAVAQNP